MKSLKKFFAAAVAGTMALGLLVAPAAEAQTIEELQAMIAQLTAQLASLSGGSSTVAAAPSSAACSYFNTTTLRRGSRGAAVSELQTALNSQGFNAGVVDGVFGGGTDAAVRAFQSAKFLGADGVMGPNSNAALTNHCIATQQAPAPSTPSTPTDGGSDDSSSSSSSSDGFVEDGSEGSVDNYSLGSAEETEALEGEEEVEIYNVEVELDDEGDLLLERVDVWFANADSATADDDPWEYFEEVFLMVDGDIVASENADSSSDWSDSSDGEITGTATANEYRMRFSGIDATLMADETTDVSVAVTMQNTIDSADQDAIWYIEIDDDGGFKFVDGTGFTFTEGAGGTTLEDSFTVGNEETASIDLSLSSDDPDPSVIAVDESSDTNGKTIAVYNVEETEDIDVTIEQITVGITIVDPAGGVDPAGAGTVAKKAYLFVDGDEIGSESVPSTADDVDITFDNLDWDLSGDQDEDVEVVVDFDDTNNSARYDNGTTIQVDAFAITEIDDANGNDEGDITTITTPGMGEIHEVRDEGIMVEFVDSDHVKTSSDTTGINETVEFTLEFDVTAFGEDAWIERTCIVGTTGADVDAIEVSLDNDADGSSTTCTDLDSTGDQGTDGFEVKKGATERFTVTILGDAGEAGAAGSPVTFTARLNGVGFNVGTDAAGTSVYAFDLDDYESDAITVFDR